MKEKQTMSALKSWGCVIGLTFFVPAVGFELSNVLFAATAEAANKISRYQEAGDVPAGPLVLSCKGLDGEEIT